MMKETLTEAPPVVLTIAGFDPSGGAGVVADVKTITAFGCFAAAAVTSLTYQNTTGVFGASHQIAETVRAQVLPVVEDFKVAGAKTGMLPTREVIEEVARLFREAVRRLQGPDRPAQPPSTQAPVVLSAAPPRAPESLPASDVHEADAAPAPQADHVSHHERRGE